MTHHERPSFTLADTTFTSSAASPRTSCGRRSPPPTGRTSGWAAVPTPLRQFLDAGLVDTIHVAVARSTSAAGSRLWTSHDELTDATSTMSCGPPRRRAPPVLAGVIGCTAVGPHMQIEVWSDVVCPWCFVGKRRLEGALADFAHRRRRRGGLPLLRARPSAPQHGHELTSVSLTRKLGRSVEEVRAMQQQLIDLGASRASSCGCTTTSTPTPSTPPPAAPRPRDRRPGLAQRELAEALFAAYSPAPRTSATTPSSPPRRWTAASTRSGSPRSWPPTSTPGGRVRRRPGAGVRRDGVPFFVRRPEVRRLGAQPTEVFAQVLAQAWTESRPALQTVGGDATRAARRLRVLTRAGPVPA